MIRGIWSKRNMAGDIFRAEIHIVAKDKNLYASSEQDDLYKAIDVVRDEMLREVRSSKSKGLSLLRRGGARVKNMIRGIWPKRNI
jgi:ribosomal subunit interface protein